MAIHTSSSPESGEGRSSLEWVVCTVSAGVSPASLRSTNEEGWGGEGRRQLVVYAFETTGKPREGRPRAARKGGALGEHIARCLWPL